MKKLNKKQKEHIKKVFVKTINIFCYVCTGILAIVLLIACLQGCQNKPRRVSAESSTQVSNLTYTNWVLNEELEPSSPFHYYINFENGDNQAFTGIGSSGDTIYYQLGATRPTAYDYDEDGWTSNDNRYLYISGGADVNNSALINWLYLNGEIQNEISYFTFNKDFNYNAPFSIDRNMPSSPVAPVGVSGTYVDYDTGYFLSNGQYFNKIRWNFKNNNAGQSFYIFTGEDIVDSHSFAGFTWVNIQYINTSTNTTIEVCSRVTGVALYEGAYVTFYQNNSLWLLDSYRYIEFLEPLSKDLSDKISQFNNNNQYYYNGGSVGGEINNIFTLIASAFTALLPILSTYLLPGITIGTLLFIPLVALLVFAIIRIIKK